MKASHLLVAVAATFASAGCNAQKDSGSTAPAGSQVEAVKPPPGGDWSQTVAVTPEGG